MLNDEIITLPAHYQEIKDASQQLQFNMLSDLKTGSMLRTLAASKPNGRFLEIGTGTGLSLAWLAETAGEHAEIISIDNSEPYQNVAKRVFGHDKRISFYCVDGNNWLVDYNGEPFDFIFADAWPGKFYNLDAALNLVKPGGFYLVDDLLPQPNWPAEHPAKVEILLADLLSRTNFVQTTFNWSTGLMLFTRIG